MEKQLDETHLFQITTHSPAAILALWSHSSDEIDFDDKEQVINYYDSLIRLRHDTFHYVISMALFGKFIPEKRIDDIYPSFDHETSGMTPDIVYQTDDRCYLIDVGFSKNSVESKYKKITKYTFLQLALSSYLNKEVEIIPLILDAKMKVDLCVKPVRKFFKHTFHKQLLFDMMKIYETKMHLIDKYGNAALISEHAKTKYSGVPVTGYTNDFDFPIEELDMLKREKYPHMPTDNDYDVSSFLHSIKQDLDNKGPLFHKYCDTKNDVCQYDNAYNIIQENNHDYETRIRPTIPILYPDHVLLEKLSGDNSEQFMIIKLMEYINQNIVDDTSSYYDFIKELSLQILKNKDDRYFKNGFFNGSFVEDFDKYKKEYSHYVDGFYEIVDGKRIKKTKSVIKNYREFLVENNYIDDKPFYSTHSKTIRFIKREMPKQFTSCWKKSGVCFQKFGKKEYVNQTTVPLEESIKMDNFIDYLKGASTNSCYKETLKEMREFISYTKMSDSPLCQKLKDIAWKEMEPWYDTLSSTRAFHFSYFNHLVYSQLMHYQSLSTKPETLHLFNCGMPNFLCIVVGGYHSVQDEAGKPFLSLCVTKTPHLYDEIYGDIVKIPLKNEEFLIISKWRRLPIMKLTFLRDSFYSTLASGLNYCSYYTEENDLKKRFLRYTHQYVLKVIIGNCTNQQIAEFLLDTRFALMSSFSKYTNIYKLLTEKFKPPYTNILSVWLINRLFKRLKIITNAMTNEKTILWKPIEYDYMGRTRSSLGGVVNIPSLWGNYKLKNIHEILDEAFIYVHTIKEPSSMYHEQVNALKTIIDYQLKFDNTKNQYKYGYLYKASDIEQYLLDDGIIGFSHPIVNQSTQHTLSIIKPNYNKIENEVLTEPVSNVVSTKAVVHSITREIVEKPLSNGYRKKYVKKLTSYFQKILSEDDKQNDVDYLIANLKKYTLSSESKFYKTKTRQKVWETLIEILERFPGCETVNQLSLELLKEQKAHVEADICIKSQYGAKREFYVVNVGAKLLARQVEKTFEFLSKITPEEAISIPGDNKLIAIQRMLDDSIQLAKNGGYKIMYVNGDCTKWSAAETMGSFLAMSSAFKNKFSEKFCSLIDLTFSSWASKEINIPISVYNKTFITTEKTTYLQQLIDKKQKSIHSTHNFLQGMFNYASSFKSVCCTNYTYHLWQKMYPNTDIKINHIEHSDDYVMIILYKDEEEFLKFRSFYKMMMRLHGFNDSERKTSCQTLFLEFVSLMSFNGEMLYPQIKKAKEINLNLPCLGYQTDVEAVLSRVGECVRVGCNLSYSYIFGKLHTYCLAEAYSLLPGMVNHFYKNYEDMFEYPIELYGIPDQYPLFSLLCKGNINNYRLYKYNTGLAKKFLHGLYALNNKIPNEIDICTETQPEFTKCFYTPRYLYDMENNQIKFIRKKLNMTTEDLVEYWQKFVVFRFVKPTKIKYLVPWMKAMFFNRLFSEAYTAVSRTKMTLRISRYVKAKTLALSLDDELLMSEDQLKNDKIKLKLYTMKEAHEKMLEELNKIEVDDVKENEVYQILVKCDASVSAIYSYLETVNIVFSESIVEKLKLCANKTPHKLTWFHIENNVSVIMQKLFSEEIFREENRNYVSDASLERDIKTVNRELLMKKPEEMSIMEVQFLFNQLSMCQQRPVVMLGYGNTINSLEDFLKVFLENGIFLDNACFINTAGVTKIVNPYTSNTYYYKDKKATKNLLLQNLENIVLLYVYLKINRKYETERIISVLDQLKFLINPETNETMTYQEVLRKFNQESKESLSLSVTELKLAAYLQKVLLNDSDLIIDLTNSVYNYGYKYYKQAERKGKMYVGDTECAFNYLNQKFYFYQHNMEYPVLLTLTKNKQINSAAYLVALRLGNHVSEKEFELQRYDHTLNKYRKNGSHFKDSYTISKKKKNLQFVLGEDWVRYDKKTDECLYAPIIKTNGYMPLSEKTFSVSTKYIPLINEEYMIVSLGRMKLYTLPFWECNQYDTIKFNRDILIDGVFLSDILKHKMIIRSFKGSKIRIKKLKKYNLSHDDFYQIIKPYIPMVPFKIDQSYKDLEIFENTDQYLEMKKREKEQDAQNQAFMSGIDLSGFGFSFNDPEDEKIPILTETKKEAPLIDNSWEFGGFEEPDDVINFDEYDMKSFFSGYNLQTVLEQKDELLTIEEEKIFFESDDDEDDKPEQKEYLDVSYGIDFSKIRFYKPVPVVRNIKLHGMIELMRKIPPFYCHKINSNYKNLKGHLLLTTEQFVNSIEKIVTKLKLSREDNLKNMLLYELYYLLTNVSLKEDDPVTALYHYEIKEKNVEIYYHYALDKNSEKYPLLRDKYIEKEIDDENSLFYLPIDKGKLNRLGNKNRSYKFPRKLTYKGIGKRTTINIDDFL